MKALLNYPGAKWKLAEEIVGLMPLPEPPEEGGNKNAAD